MNHIRGQTCVVSFILLCLLFSLSSFLIFGTPLLRISMNVNKPINCRALLLARMDDQAE